MADVLNILGSTSSTPPSSRLSYPQKIFSDYTDYVKFDFYKYSPPFAQNPGGSTSNRYNGASYEKYPGLQTVLLYMPEDITAQYTADWGGKGFTNVAANALQTAGTAGSGNGGGFVNSVTTAITQAGQRFSSLEAQALAGAISNAPGGIGGQVGIEDVLGGVGGVILNPNVELMFEGFGLRNFSLSFKMAPRNAEETKIIRSIVGTFKKCALPTLGQQPSAGSAAVAAGIGGFIDKLKTFLPPDAQGSDNESSPDQNANYIGVPGLVWVQFMKGGELHPFLPQYKVCAITDVSVSYTPDGSYATYGGAEPGSPVATELSISFQETKLVYSNDIVVGGTSY
jgi:hypothetical protein